MLLAPFFCNALLDMPRPVHPELQLSLPEILDVAHCKRNTSATESANKVTTRAHHWHMVVLSNYMIDAEWLLLSDNCSAALSPVGGCEKLVILSGESDTSDTVRALETSGGWSHGASAGVVVGYGGVLSTNSQPTILKQPKWEEDEEMSRTEGQRSAYGASRNRLATALGNGNAILLYDPSHSCGTRSCTSFARVIKPHLPIPFGTHHSKAVLAINELGIRVAIFTANFVFDDWNRKNQGIYCEDFPYKRATAATQSATAPSCMELELIRYFAAAGWRDASKVLSLFDFSSSSVKVVASVPGYHSKPTLSSAGSAGVGGLWGMWHLDRQLSCSDRCCGIRPPLIVPQRMNEMLPCTSWFEWAERCWRVRNPRHLTWQYSSQGSLTPAFLDKLASIMSRSGSSTEGGAGGGRGGHSHLFGLVSEATPTKAAVRHANVKVVFPTIEEVRYSVEGWRGGSSIPVPSKNLNNAINERLYKFGGGEGENGTHPRRRAMPHIKTYALCSPIPNTSHTATGGEAVLSSSTTSNNGGCLPAMGLEWLLLTSANLSRAAWGDEQKGGSQLMVRSYELGVLLRDDDGEDFCTKWGRGFTVTPWAVGSDAYGPAGKRLTPETEGGTPPPDQPRTFLRRTFRFSSEIQNAVFASDGVFLAPLKRMGGALSLGGTVACLAPLPYDPVNPTPYSSTVGLHLHNELQAQSSSSSSAGTLSAPIAVPPPPKELGPYAFRPEVILRDSPWVVDAVHSGLDSLGRTDEQNRLVHTHYGSTCWRAPALNFSRANGIGDPIAETASPSWKKMPTQKFTASKRSRSPPEVIELSSDDQ